MCRNFRRRRSLRARVASLQDRPSGDSESRADYFPREYAGLAEDRSRRLSAGFGYGPIGQPSQSVAASWSENPHKTRAAMIRCPSASTPGFEAKRPADKTFAAAITIHRRGVDWLLGCPRCFHGINQSIRISDPLSLCLRGSLSNRWCQFCRISLGVRPSLLPACRRLPSFFSWRRPAKRHWKPPQSW